MTKPEKKPRRFALCAAVALFYGVTAVRIPVPNDPIGVLFTAFCFSVALYCALRCVTEAE